MLAVDTCDGSAHLTGGGGDDVLTLHDLRLGDYVGAVYTRECDSDARGHLDGGPGHDRCTQVEVAIRC